MILYEELTGISFRKKVPLRLIRIVKFHARQMASTESVGPISSIFGNDVTSKVIDFLAIQSDSKTIIEISQGLGIASHRVKYAVDVLVNNNVLGIDESEVLETVFHNPSKDRHYHIRNDSPAGIGMIQLYNYFNSLMDRRIVLCSSDAGTLDR